MTEDITFPALEQDGDYQPPTIIDLGTLAEMTLGGDEVHNEASGGASTSSGSL